MTAIPRRPFIQIYQLLSGRRLLTRLDELSRTQWLTRAELTALQRRKLNKVLSYAYEYVPYYRTLFDEHSFRPNDVLTSMESFERLPLLTKSIVQNNLELMVTTEPRRRSILSELSTSGSTGTPTIFYQDNNFRDYVTADYHRHLGWAGWKLGDPHFYIWGTHLEGDRSKEVRSRLMDWSLNRFVTNAFVFSDETMADLTTLVRSRRPKILFSYVSSAYRFASYLRERGINDIRFDAVITSAEILHSAQREIIEDAFECKVFDRYATRELAGIGCECSEHNGMHVSMENVYLEILKGGQSAPPEERGDIVVTNLNNYGMPFIRYSVDDVGSWSSIDFCPCGRRSIMMNICEGRNIDQFRTRDGHYVAADVVTPLFRIKGVKQFQLIQKDYNLIVIRIAGGEVIEQERLDLVSQTLREALGAQTEIRYDFPDELPVLESGKHRYFICEVTDKTLVRAH